MSTADAKPDAARRARTELVGRLVLAHFATYPLLFVGALAGMSLSIVLQKEALLAAGLANAPSTGAQRWLMAELGLAVGDAVAFEVIMRPLGLVLLAIFVLAHASSVPWGLAARRHALGELPSEAVRRARNLWIVATLGVTGALALAGLGGWLVILAGAGG